MLPLPQHIKVCIFQRLEGDIDIAGFEQWVYTCKELETLLPPDDYLDLIAFPYKQPGIRYELDKLLNRYIDQGEFETYKLRNLLQVALLQDERLPDLLSKCYDLYCHGYYFLSGLGMQYGLAVEIDEWFKIPWPQQQVLLEQWSPGLETELRQALHWLDTGLIVLTGMQTDPGHYDYEDYRPAV